jgi:hypothetical protein
MANYVERDGDWVWRPPGALDQTKMFVFAFQVTQLAAIQKLCDDFVNTPSGGAVQAAPFSTSHPFVLLVCADIERACSQHPGDTNKGYAVERDMGFFVPITFTATSGTSSTAMLLPYLFVDNLAALLVGREIFGFPKLLGEIAILEDPPFAEVIAPALPVYGPERVVVDRPILQLRTVVQQAPQLCASGPVVSMTLAILTSFFSLLGIPAPLGGFSKIPMVFLKQFRDVAADGVACYQAITRAEGSIGAIRRACLHLDTFELTVFPHDSIDIAGGLGLGAGPTFQPVAAARVDLDFSLDFGTTEWKAP